MDRRHSYDLERRQELHNELDKLEIPEDRSNSDISAEYTPKRGPSPVPGSPLDESEGAGSFSRQTVHKMMDWSQTHITPSEGRFPQVSAPTMDIDSEGNDFQLEEMKEERVAQMPRQPKGKDSLTFSPQQGQAWFFTPGRRKASKHSFSGNTSEVMGSALLGPNQSHQGDSAYKTALDNSVMQDEVYKLKTAYTKLRAELQSEQEARYQSDRIRQSLEREKNELTEQVRFLQGNLDLLQAGDGNKLEQVRGKQLELAKAELARVKTAFSELNAAHVELQHVLSQKLAESPAGKEKELEEMTLEIAKLKIVNTAAARKEREMMDRLENAAKQLQLLSDQLQTQQDLHTKDLQTYQSRLTQQAEQCEHLQEELSLCKATLKDTQSGYNADSENKARELQEIESLKLTIDVLQTENTALRKGQTPQFDYQTQLAKVKSNYESQISKLKNQYESQISKQKPNNSDELWSKKLEECHILERNLREKVEELKSENEELERQFRDELESRTSAFEEERSKSLSFAQTNRKLQSELQLNSETISRLTLELEEWKENCKQAENSVEMMKQTMEVKKRRPSVEGGKISELQTQLADLQHKFQREETEKGRFEVENTRIRLKLEEMKSQLLKAHEENERLTSDLRHREKKKEMTLSEEFDAKFSELGVESMRQYEVAVQVSLEIPLSQEVKARLQQGEEAAATAQALRQEKLALASRIQQLMDKEPNQSIGVGNDETPDISKGAFESFEESHHKVMEEQDLGDFAPDTLRSELEAAEQLKQQFIAREDELQSALETALKDNENLTLQIENLEYELKESKQEIEYLKREIEDFKQEMENEVDLRTDLERKIAYMSENHEKILADLQLKTENARENQDLIEKQRLSQAEIKLKTLYEQKLQSKTKEIDEIKSQLSQTESQLATLREEINLKQDKSRQETSKQRRELEREVRSLQEELKHASEKVKQELELEFLSRLNNEKKEADRKMRNKIKVVQEKHQQELASQEALLKVQFDKQLADQAKSLGDQHRSLLRQKESEFHQERTRLQEEHEEMLRQFTYEKSQMLSEYERRLRRPSLEASDLKTSLRVSKSGFQDSVLTINDFRPDESEIAMWSLSNADRLGMVREDMLSYWVRETEKRIEQKLVEKVKIQKYVETQCRAAREAEQSALAQAVAEELAGRSKSKFLAPLRERLVTENEARLREMRAAQEAVVQKYRAKVSQLETALVQKTKKEPSPLPPDTYQEDSVFVRVGGHLYLSLKCAVEDLALVADCFEAAVAPPKRRTRTSEMEGSMERQKDAYRQLLNSLQLRAADVTWSLRSQPRERIVTSEVSVQCLLSEEEKLELAKTYETRLRQCQEQLDTAQLQCHRQSRVEDMEQEWESQRKQLEMELRTAKVKLREWEESPVLVPEMLSPSETCELVVSVLSRAHRQSFLEIMTLEHPEFFSLLQDFLASQ